MIVCTCGVGASGEMARRSGFDAARRKEAIESS